MRLIDLLGGDANAVIGNAAIEAIDVAGLTCDSRNVAPGFLFAALPGTRADGRAFVPDAVRKGAVAVLASRGASLERGAYALVEAENPRRAYALMASRFYGRQPDFVAAVTGTNGKTSTVTFARQIWARLGCAAASVGTLGVVAPKTDIPGSLTTPDPVDLHRTLKALAEEGVTHLAMEASSHGLDQYRLDGVKVRAAAFTNLTRDHLDYHGTTESYLAAKRRLFEDVLVADGVAVVNVGAPFGDAIEAACRKRKIRVLGYGAEGVDIRLDSARPVAEGQHLNATVFGRAHEVLLPLHGAFQAENALCALGLAIAGGEDANAAVAALGALRGVPGRVQKVGVHPNGAPVFVDYAHTPDALATVLRALRPHARGRLRVVFGCGGDRDPGKRPEMARIAGELADAVIVTDDNPRNEDPADIRRQVLAGYPEASEIGDRAEAILAAVRALAPDDLLVIAGKGHERGQIAKGEVRPFDDAEVARAAIREAAR